MGATGSKPESDEDPMVETKCGLLRGRVIKCDGKEANAFLGIPFAQPPVGTLRFRRPVPPLPWQGIREAKQFAPQCPQWSFFKLPVTPPSSEDCLYLNVFAPPSQHPNGSAPSSLPVLVFIHGGAFTMGTAKMAGDVGLCRKLVAAHQLVVVTVHYRVGVFGFFSTGDEACDDNVGLWDMTMALCWVRENIAQFGSEAENVTLLGQSAGGMAVDLLALSPHSRDLFHKVVCMAGNAHVRTAIQQNMVENCRQFAHKLGIFTTDTEKRIEQLRKMPASKLTVRFDEFGFGELGDIEMGFGPRLDSRFFPRPLEQLRHEAGVKPRIVGLCKMEGSTLMAFHPNKKYSLSLLERIVARQFPESEYPTKFIELRAESLKMFTKGAQDGEQFGADKKRVTRAIAEILSDLFVGIGAQQDAMEQIALGNQHCYLYSFDHRNARILALLGLYYRSRVPVKEAVHGTELFYLFGNLNNGLVMREADEEVSRVTCTLMANFARHGNPNCPAPLDGQLPFVWGPVSAEHPSQFLSIIRIDPLFDSFKINFARNMNFVRSLPATFLFPDWPHFGAELNPFSVLKLAIYLTHFLFCCLFLSSQNGPLYALYGNSGPSWPVPFRCVPSPCPAGP